MNADGEHVIAAINAGFFDLEGGTGISENNVVVDGEIVKGVAITESPFDRGRHIHSQVAIEKDGRPAIDQFRLTGTVRSTRGRWTLGTINGAPTRRHRCALYRVDGAAASVPFERQVGRDSARAHPPGR